MRPRMLGIPPLYRALQRALWLGVVASQGALRVQLAAAQEAAARAAEAEAAALRERVAQLERCVFIFLAQTM
jgi:hypothetical protein